MKNTQLKRIGGFIIDIVIIGTISKLIDPIIIPYFEPEHYILFGIDLTISYSSSIFFHAVYFIAFDIFNKGVTIGKILVKVKVTSINATNPTRWTNIARTIFKLLSIILLPVAALIFLLGNYFSLHEFLTKTKTISTKP